MEKKVVIPWELKYKFAMGGWTSLFKGVMYAIREEYSAEAVFKIFERVWNMDDRVKNLTNTILNVFKIEGNDAETIAKCWDIWWELNEADYTWLERSETISRIKITKCPWKIEPKDLSGWCDIFANIFIKVINPNAIGETIKAMCAGDQYCDFVYTIEE